MGLQYNCKKIIIIGAVLSLIRWNVYGTNLELHHVEPTEIKSFENILIIKDANIDYWANGKSMIFQNQLLESQKMVVPNLGGDRAYLLWSGEIDEWDKKATQINLLTPKNKWLTIKAERVFKIKGHRSLYSCLAQVEALKGGGLFQIKGLKATKTGEGVFTVAGFAVIVIYPVVGQGPVSLVFKAGLERLQPGEYYNLDLTEGLAPLEQLRVLKLTTIGGHGKEGNGSANMVNYLTTSEREDWAGASGKYWDVKTYDFSKVNIEAQKGANLTYDPLLQWIFPTAVIVKFGKTKKEGGEKK